MSATKQLTKLVLLTVAFLVGLAAHAQPTIDSLNVQGYMTTATGTAVADGTYNVVFGVLQGGTAIWAREYSTVITDGLFSKTLSGAGSDLTGGLYAHCTGLDSDWTGETLNSTTLNAGTAGATVVRVCSRSTINGVQTVFDITVAAAPTSMVADVANSVRSGASANHLARGTPSDVTLGVVTNYTDAAPYVFNQTFQRIIPSANVAITLRCINSTLAVPGSELMISFNPNLATYTATNFTVQHNTACTGNNKTIRTNTVAALAGATNNSPSFVHLIYDGTSWQVVAFTN